MAISNLGASEVVGRWRGLNSPYAAAALDAICIGDIEDTKRKLKYLQIEGQNLHLCELGLKKLWMGTSKLAEDDQMGGILFGGPVQAVSFYGSASAPAQGLVDSNFVDKEKIIADLERQNLGLCRLAAQHAPHKQFLRTALAFLVFFSAVLTIQLIPGVWLIASTLAWAGMAVSASAILLSYLAALDWRDWRSRGVSSH